MNRSRRAALGLHFHNRGNRPPKVWLALRHPGVGPLAHRRSWRNWIDGDGFIQLVSNASNGFVTIEGREGFRTHNH